MQLAKVVASTLERVDLRFADICNDFPKFRRATEETLEVVLAVVGAKRLVLTVGRVRERAQQAVGLVARKKRIPVRSPQHLDYVPPRAAEQRLKFLDDLAVAAHRTVKPLQVAIDDESQVVEAFARGQSKCANRFRFVHLAVADHGPHTATAGIDDAAVLEIAHEPRLVDRAHRANAHRPGGELPEFRHQPRVRIRRQALPADLLPKIGQVRLGKPPFEKGPRIDAGRRMRLEENQVAATTLVRPKEMIETDFKNFRGRRVTADVATEFAVRDIGAHDHRQCIPAHDRRDALLDAQVSGVQAFAFHRNGVAVRRVRRHVRYDAVLLCLLLQEPQQCKCTLVALDPDDRFERIEPFARLVGIAVDRVVLHGDTIMIHGSDPRRLAMPTRAAPSRRLSGGARRYARARPCSGISPKYIARDANSCQHWWPWCGSTRRGERSGGGLAWQMDAQRRKR